MDLSVFVIALGKHSSSSCNWCHSKGKDEILEMILEMPASQVLAARELTWCLDIGWSGGERNNSPIGKIVTSGAF